MQEFGGGGWQVGREGGCGAGMRGMRRGAPAQELRGAGGVRLPAEPRTAHHYISALKQILLAELGYLQPAESRD